MIGVVITALDRARGCLLGLAVGDALGHPTEFVPSLAAIRSRWGPQGVTDFEPAGRHPAGTYTDDTQMALCVARALIRSGHDTLDALMATLGEEFVAWSRSPRNNRAPGGTCLAGCRALARGVAWQSAGVKGSKGCGAAMRAAPVGFFYADRLDAMLSVSAAQSTLTHAHPTAIASGVAAAACVAWVCRGASYEGLIDFTLECVKWLTDERLVYLGCDPRMVEHLGVSEMVEALERTALGLQEPPVDDVCQLLGEAWVGEEAVACALECALRAGDDFGAAVLRGANSGGDSDSIACIAGSLAGARLGPEAIAERWRSGLEDSARIEALAEALTRARAGEPVHLDASLDFFDVASLARGDAASWRDDSASSGWGGTKS